MREVRTCDFCGEDATGVYEVVPASADGAVDARRMLLCDDCRETLASVVDPLLETLESEGDVAADATTESTTDGADAGTDTDAGAATAGQEADADADSGSGSGIGTGSTEAGGRPISERGPPQGYRKVLRFLENRELPMDRDDAEELVADAYGMNHEEVEAALDHAVKHNRLRDVNGELRR